VVDILDHDRPTLGGDPAGEPAPNRDADALLDLLFETFRGPGDELVRAFVEQQDRGSICRQHLADARQELVEKLVRREMRKRGVGHDLEPREQIGSLQFS
jgi:hypothetical protein